MRGRAARRGLPVDDRPHVSIPAVAASIGTIWGLLGYTILWEGEPVAVQRPFVQSAVGTLALLPVRIVLWAIRLAETIAGRTFELSANHEWIALVAAAVGATVLVAVAVAVRRIAAWRRRAAHPSR